MEKGNNASQRRWNKAAVGSQRSSSDPGTKSYYQDIETYRYGYETPFIPELLLSGLEGRKVLELGVGNGIDAALICKNASHYTGMDITENHIALTKKYLNLSGFDNFAVIHSDLLDYDFKNEKFDVIYSFGTLHHISHEVQILRKMKSILNPGGEIRIAVYSKFSFFNLYMLVTWIIKNRMKVSLNKWQGLISDAASFDDPIVIKLRTRRQCEILIARSGLKVRRYYKRGFPHRNIPFFGKYLATGGLVLTGLSAILGWYHIFVIGD